MTLGDKQRLFTLLISKLISHSYGLGYALTVGDAYRDARSHGPWGTRKEDVYGRRKSNHKRRLAMDFNLFKQVNGEMVYMTSSEAYEELGRYWESLHELCCWGGRFQDGNHFSLLHEGMR